MTHVSPLHLSVFSTRLEASEAVTAFLTFSLSIQVHFPRIHISRFKEYVVSNDISGWTLYVQSFSRGFEFSKAFSEFSDIVMLHDVHVCVVHKPCRCDDSRLARLVCQVLPPAEPV